MKYIVPTSDHPYYLWQVLVQAQAFRELGEHGVWVIYYDQEPSPLLLSILDADVGEVHVIPDWPRDRSYNSAMKEWVTARYLAEHPEPGPVALYDPDAIPTRKLALKVEPGVLYGSDTDSYTGPAYLKDKGAWDGLCKLVGVDAEHAEAYAGIGAQYVWRDMPAGFWEEVAQLSVRAFDWLKTVPPPEGSNAVQAWCADMFITQLVAIREGWEPRVAPELSMVWAGGPASGWDTAGVFHNAGIVEPTPGHFCKLTYQTSPFFRPLEFIREDSASARFVELIRATEAAWPEACNAFLGSQSSASDSDRDELDYVRTQTPDLELLRRHGSPRTLLQLTAQRAALLVLVPSHEAERTATLARLPTWEASLPGVTVVPVVDGSMPSPPISGLPISTLFDPDSRAAGLFGADGARPSAVLLGADGLLAGGPVHGADAIAQFVVDVAAALDEAEAVPWGRRALVTYVEDRSALVQQLLALRRSLLALPSDDTDIVAIGPNEVLRGLPDDLVKIPQRPACDDPAWRDYRYVNSIACLNGAGSEQLLEYTHLLRTDVDTFLFPGWDSFRPSTFRWGTGGYAGEPEVHDNIAEVAAIHGLTHRGLTSIGSTWYGPTDLVRRTAALSEMLTKYIVNTSFARDPGAWPGWYQGVSLLYAGEIAVNHLAANGSHATELDCFSTSTLPASDAVHVHCWHTDEPFSKHHFMAGRYSAADIDLLPAGSVAQRSLEFSLASVADLHLFVGRC